MTALPFSHYVAQAAQAALFKAKSILTHPPHELLESCYLLCALPAWKDLLAQQVTDLRAQLRLSHPEYLIIIGIGGSTAGTRAVEDLLFSQSTKQIKVIYLDTIDHDITSFALIQIKEIIAQRRNVLMLIISKSGTTLETAVNTALCYDLFKRSDAQHKLRIMALTDEGSPLWHHAQEQKWLCGTIPRLLGGRYSLFSVAALLPLSLMGLNIDHFLKGACHAAQELDNNTSKAIQHAAFLVAAFRQGYTVHDLFLAQTGLTTYGLWYRQLIGESLGKTKLIADQTIPVGLMPTISSVPQDLHSLIQLYLAGPPIRVTTFFERERAEDDQQITLAAPLLWSLDLLDKKSMVSAHQCHTTLWQSVQTLYQKHSLPYRHIMLAPCSTYEVGKLFYNDLIAVILAGELLEINPFNQPQVEQYKHIVKEQLQ